jgi:hypothetical protein
MYSRVEMENATFFSAFFQRSYKYKLYSYIILTSPRLALGLPCRELWGLAPWGPKVPLELNNGALPHMAQRSEGFLQNPYII